MNDFTPLSEEEIPTQATASSDCGRDQPPVKNARVLLPLLFGRYRPIRELGRGGMGVVMEARDEVLGLSVALKMVPDQVFHDTEGIGDLKKEVLRGMALTHPGIVRVYSFEQDATGAAIVMECVQGETLAALKVRQPNRCFNCEELLPWVQQLCASLDYAHHDARIAHRDLKPANLLLTSTQRLKIADFGIASSLSETLTRVSVRSDSTGTPPYMSPQQAMGERPSHLDDIYSLGATLYELLTGKPPFFRGNILAQTLHEQPPSMAQRRAEFKIVDRPSIPEAWEKLVMACLAKEPNGRPPNGAAVLAILAAPVVVAIKPTDVIQVIPVKAAVPVAQPVAQELPPLAFADASIAAEPIPSMMKFNRARRDSGHFPFRDWAWTCLLITTAAALTAGALHMARSYVAGPKPETFKEAKAASPAPSVSLLDPKGEAKPLRRSSLPLRGAVLDRLDEARKK
ncbi:MAG: hypothetical protein JWL90_455 [Chthoniobacteraceae bacterium]|nr:hypothetical protein [Chthoniobacteraceae bacterium]